MTTPEETTEAEDYTAKKARLKKLVGDERDRFIDRLFTVNLGGTVALLGFFGASYARGTEIEGRLILVIFLVGLISSLIHYFAASFSTHLEFVEILKSYDDNDYEEYGRTWADGHLETFVRIFKNILVASILTSMFCFVVGVVLAIPLLFSL